MGGIIDDPRKPIAIGQSEHWLCEKQLAAKDAEIAQLRSENERLKEMRDSQINYSIKLQQLLESLKREDTPHPELHHYQMVISIKAENAALRERIAALEKQLDAANLGWA